MTKRFCKHFCIDTMIADSKLQFLYQIETTVETNVYMLNI